MPGVVGGLALGGHGANTGYRRARLNAFDRKRTEALIRAAATLIGEKGLDGATMTEIATRAESAIGSLYQFFPTKQGITLAVTAQMAEQMDLRIGLLAQAIPEDAFDRLADGPLDFFCALREEMPA